MLRPGENPFIPVNHILDLGVLISKDSKWKGHILKARQKGIKVLRFDRRVLPFSLSIGKKLMYNSKYPFTCFTLLGPLLFQLSAWKISRKKVLISLSCITNVPWKD